jgi:glycosyltransferase involved in cell wall biosynthesis
MSQPICKVIIPALNEERSIGLVLREIDSGIVNEVVVVDNGSADSTALVAREHGATVLVENNKGYGAACLKGINYIKKSAPDTGIIIFMDADYSDFPEEIESLIQPIVEGKMDMVIGSRVLGKAEPGSLTPVQRFGNWLSCRLMKLFYKATFTDLGPFRAIRFNQLLNLEMQDRNYGWTVEMQVKAAKKGLKSVEIPVSYRNRIGQSKVSGTIKGSILAGTKILYTIFKNF